MLKFESSRPFTFWSGSVLPWRWDQLGPLRCHFSLISNPKNSQGLHCTSMEMHGSIPGLEQQNSDLVEHQNQWTFWKEIVSSPSLCSLRPSMSCNVSFQTKCHTIKIQRSAGIQPRPPPNNVSMAQHCDEPWGAAKGPPPSTSHCGNNGYQWIPASSCMYTYCFREVTSSGTGSFVFRPNSR